MGALKASSTFCLYASRVFKSQLSLSLPSSNHPNKHIPFASISCISKRKQARFKLHFIALAAYLKWYAVEVSMSTRISVGRMSKEYTMGKPAYCSKNEDVQKGRITDEQNSHQAIAQDEVGKGE
jgi:hypothetical protein